ncbi:MAG: hypothetical protein R3F30_13500 [Planctomycetota bacterium]
MQSKAASSTLPWIHNAGWDLRWLIGSSLIVPIILVLVWANVSSDVLNLGVTALIGGPHLFATYVATYMDPRFRRAHMGFLLLATLLIPAIVVFLALWNIQILLSVFIFAASVHVLHQNLYLTDVYRTKQGTERGWYPRLVDYGLLMLCLYPIASYKLVNGDFWLGDVEILIPPMVKTPATYWTVWILFSFFLSAWLHKSFREVRQGVLNVPKTVLIGATTVIGFFVPIAAGGERLELAFQSVNAWHSIQYLGIVWYIQAVRRRHGFIDSPLVKTIAGSDKKHAFRFYGFCFLVTLALLGVALTLVSTNPFGLTGPNSREQYYYMCVLSPLLIHYALDGYFFTVSTRRDASVADLPYAATLEPSGSVMADAPARAAR